MTESTAPVPWTRARPVHALQWGVVGLGLLFHAWSLWGGFFHMDDFFYLADSARPFLEYVGQVYNGHLMPAGFAIVWVSQAIAPMSWTLAVVAVMGLWAAFLVGSLVLLRRLFAESYWTLVTLVILAFAPLLTTVTVWYASALQILPWGAALVWMLYFAARDAERPSARWWVAATAVYIVGLAFWEKTLLALPCVLWLAWRFWPGSGRLGLGGLGRRWLLPAATILVSLLYSAAYVLAQREPVLRSDPTAQQLVDSVRISLGEVWVPSYFGAPWTGFSEGLSPGSSNAWWMFLILWQIVAALVIVSVLRWRSAWNAWALLAGYAAVTVALFAFGRINAFGLVLAYDPRYVEDLFILGAVVLPFAFVRPRGSALPSPRPLSWLPTSPRPTLRLVALVGFVNLLLLPSVAVATSWQDSAAKRFVSRARATFDANPGIPVLDRKVPPEVMAPLFLERANASYVLAGLRIPVRWDGAGPILLGLNDAGEGVRPDIAVSSSSVQGLDGECGWRVYDGPIDIELDRTLFDWIWVGRMDYLAAGTGEAQVQLSDRVTTIPLQEGLHQVSFVVVGEGDTLTMTPPPGAGVCVSKVVLGQPDISGQS